MARRMNNLFQSTNDYKIKDGVAYTEDDVEIHKIFLYKIPVEVSQQELMKYFNKFGKVIRAQMLGRNNFGTRTAYVYFANPRDAAKALVRSHILNRRSIGIKPSDSWLQPNAYQPNFTRKPKLSIADLSPSVPLIYTLNQYCFQLILELLPLVDRVRFARTCIRFNDLYQLCSPSLHKVIKLDEFERATVWDMFDFFTKSGRYIKEVTGEVPLKHRNRLIEFFSKHCKNLQKLHLDSSVLSKIDMQKIFGNLENLVDVKLQGCNLKNSNLLALKSLNQLKHLDLSENLELSGENMQQLPASIETLTLSSCLKINPSKITKFLQRLPLLKSLNLLMVKSLKTQGFKEMVSYCQALEELHISVCKSEAYETLAQLPSLTNLIIHEYNNEQLRYDLFAELIQHKSAQLKHLEIPGIDAISSKTLLQLNQLGALQTLKVPQSATFSEKDMQSLCELSQLQYLNLSHCDNVTNNLVIRLIISCQNLNQLCLTSCAKLDDALVYEIIEKIQLQTKKIDSTRKLPIKMYVYRTSISDHIFENPDYKNAKNIISVSFEPSYNFSHPELSFNFDLDIDSDDEYRYYRDHLLFDVGFLSDNDLDEVGSVDFESFYDHDFFDDDSFDDDSFDDDY